MARALIVACGCRGRLLGKALGERGWTVRGTSRDEAGLEVIAGAGIEPAKADPERPATVLDLIADVAVLHWLLGSAGGEPERVAAIHGPRLERLLEKLVDTPLRGFAYEAAGTAPAPALATGEALVTAAAARWRIPVEVVAESPADADAWLAAMLAASERLVA